MFESFNTSYVSVQDVPNVAVWHFGDEFQYILCVGSSDDNGNVYNCCFVFQYILCVGSRLININLKKI